MKNLITVVIAVVCVTFIFFSCTEDGINENGFGTLEGKVVSQGDNLPIANAKITTSPTSNTVFTDENGDFSMGQVQVGEYSVQAEADTYVTAFEAANIVEGQTINVVFELVETSAANIPPLAPSLIFPEDNATGINTELDFVWSSSNNDSDDILYAFELRNGVTSEIILEEQISDTTFTVSGLEVGTNYFWQVRASDDVNPPVESTISSFTTLDVVTNRFFYTREDGDNLVIFSGTVDAEGNPDQGEFQLTSSSTNSFRPRKDNTANKIAFLRTVGADIQLFVMNLDGTEIQQITDEVPVAGFRQDEVDFTWHLFGQRIYYPNFNKLYSIVADGTGSVLMYEAPVGTFITEIDANEANNLVAVKTNDADGYNARIAIVNPNNGDEIAVVIEGIEGALGGIDFSIDGTKVLYTRDVSGFENSEYRQLDSRIFEYDIPTDTTKEINTAKEVGTNDLDVRYSPNEGSIIFTNTSNDGISPKFIYRMLLDNQENKLLSFTNAFMPDWE
ncbi:MAG: carboxypeptidase-like regulatory domain-containing protein [Bacteroidota bacterium]